MIKIHLAQIYYNTSYFDSPIDYLEEPVAFNGKDIPLGRFRSIESIQEYLVETKSAYIEHIHAKVLDIADWSGKNGCHFLVFPEYSIPPQLLLDLQKVAQNYKMIIIAGSHRVQSGHNVESIYRSLNIYEESNFIGCAGSPIICPDGKVFFAKKLKKSKWESNLVTPETEPKSFQVNCKGELITISVIPCIDSLHIENIGRSLSDNLKRPDIIFCPSESPPTNLFESVASLLASNQTLFCYVNTAESGGSFYNIPKAWGSYLKGHLHPHEKLQPNIEAILELVVDPKCFYVKKGTLENSPNCYHPFPYPIICTKMSEWLDSVIALKNEVIEWVKHPDIVSALEWMDLFLSENVSKLPDLVGQNLKYLRHSILPLYDDNIDTIEKSFSYVSLREGLESTLILWANRVNKSIDILSNLIKEVPDDLADSLFSCLKDLRNNIKKLPSVNSEITLKKTYGLNKPSEQLEFSGETEIIESFQNRGADIDQVRNFLGNPDNKVIVITGAIGIGKSAFINWMFKKQFGDWEVLRIYISKETRAPRLISEIAYLVGSSIDIDSLSTATSNVFRKIVRKIFEIFYQKQKRALVIDDLHDILKSGTARDHNQLSILLEEAANCKQYVGGRIFVVSSQWLPWKWVNQSGAAHLSLKRINDIYVRRIIEFHMRRCNLIKDESIPEPPEDLIDLIKGHPLSAKIVVDVIKDKEFKELSRSVNMKEISGYVASELLKHVTLSDDEIKCMQLLSVFRKPVDLNMLKNISVSDLERTINGLSARCILNYDGKYLEINEAVRRYFVSIIKKEDIDKLHNIAASYYQNKYEYEISLINKNPSIAAEFVHHLSLSHQIDKANELKILIVEEIKPTARKLYRDKQYSSALELYKLLQKSVPDDVEVLAYIGRCNARFAQWQNCDAAFQSAIDVARRTGQQVWWLYRDWGHIKARYNYFDDAKMYFEKASNYRPNDPSIKSSLAYMHWRQDDYDQAGKLFEEVVSENPYHKYTLTYYSRFLNETGDYNYAELLQDRLYNLENDYEYRKPFEYDIDEDYDD